MKGHVRNLFTVSLSFLKSKSPASEIKAGTNVTVREKAFKEQREVSCNQERKGWRCERSERVVEMCWCVNVHPLVRQQLVQCVQSVSGSDL